MTTDDWTDATGPALARSPLADKGMKDVGTGTVQCPPDPQHRERLRRTIETEIVPRLIAARGRTRSPATEVVEPQRHVEATDCRELQRLLLAHDSTVAGTYVEALINQGVAREEIFVDLLAPVARGFGQLWEDDMADFTQITVALGRLQVLLHELGRDACDSAEPGQAQHSILLISMPGEQHTFGLLVICDFFRHRGWNACCEFPRTVREALELASSHHFDVIGVSLAGDQKGLELAALVSSVRRAARNDDVRILVGGPLFLRRPEAVAEVGADGTAATGEDAVAEAERLVRGLVDAH